MSGQNQPTLSIYPTITFGIEVEFVFCIPDTTLNAYSATTAPSQNLQADAKTATDDQQWPITPRAVSMTPRALARRLHDSNPDYYQQNWTIANLELISPVFEYCSASRPSPLQNEALWFSQLRQIQHDLQTPRAETQILAVANKTCGFHVHIGISYMHPNPMMSPSQAIQLDAELTLNTIKNVVILYGVSEELIARMHPAHRSPPFNRYAHSIRLRSSPPYSPFPYRHSNFAAMVNGTSTLQELSNLISCPVITDLPQFTQLSISPPSRNGSKPVTLEFRQAAGTLDAEEMRWWIRFVGGLVKYASHVTDRGLLLAPRGPEEEELFWTTVQKTLLLECYLGNEGMAWWMRRLRSLDALKIAGRLLVVDDEGEDDEDYD